MPVGTDEAAALRLLETIAKELGRVADALETGVKVEP